MDKDELKEMASNPDFIPGIYNYCDRWCERCAYTSNCFLFATEKSQYPDTDSHDLNQEEFWKGMEDIFALTFELLEDTAEELGIDFDEMETQSLEKKEAEVRSRAEQHPAAQHAHQYISEVKRWFDNTELLFNEKAEEMVELASLDLPEPEISKEAYKLKDFVDIIRWYQHQIAAKIMRALQGKMYDLGLDEDPIQNDHNGSAKVALMGIDRSIAAWGGLLNIFPEKEDSILHMLVQLEKMRKNVQREFPNARQFKRPGFDE